ncbi:hypothetical protein VITFI_CDS1527 [Vitreoscilla filiformis]|uniref:DUF2730 domain-containing protein n=1 Tax=Vitreoscilla filiformis TaxID=63 RepID=A0A221KA60_VITFI|nr:hypothetical protein [Vitreoscilla filiformis]ASM75896.1 hypothetical protein VITFI_CDS0117 [Vitreoscilla filiformis]ASM76430.1 hypothetical protein VITFI_CDS0651 [Vitreoscilla filiformis]ASM76846.1 hypothetical protein VITFI_CDS1068 [Vitreoscilla filiformis]ASM77305.1 hypothetical protein VITFI_CDS1527 [Vitreoscilla filiformis]
MDDFSNPSFWLSAGSTLVSLATAAAVWLRKPGEQALGALAAFETRHAEQHVAADKEHRTLVERVVVVETKLVNLATKGDVAEVRGDVDALRQATDRNGQVLARIETYLLTNRG